MGLVFGKNIDDVQNKRQEFILEDQTLALERQIHMQNQMRERAMAMQIAGSRDLFMWFGSFYALSLVSVVGRVVKTGRRGQLVPLLPLTFILGYEYDMAYYTKIDRIRAEADRILNEEKGLLDLPHGVPTILSIDQTRRKQEDFGKLQ